MASIKPYKTGSGQKRYRVIWRVDGRQVEETKRTYAEAKDRKTEVESAALSGPGIDPAPGKQTLNDYFDAWLPARRVEGEPLRKSTKQGYEALWRRNVRKTLGRRQLRDVRPLMVRTFYGDLAEGKSQDQAAKTYRLLHVVFASAVEDELIRFNPCRMWGAGREHAAERPFAEIPLVLELAAAIRERYFALVVLVAFSSTRTGEALGLRRRDVDLLHGEIHVQVQAQELTGEGRVVLEFTKNDAGRRVVAIPRLVADALERHLDAYTAADPDAPVFTGPRGGPLRRSRLSEAWTEAKNATGASAQMTIYDLRHSAATLTARKPGITLKELMARIGHSSMAAALRYQHAAQERDREVADFLDEQIEAAGINTTASIASLDASRRR